MDEEEELLLRCLPGAYDEVPPLPSAIGRVTGEAAASSLEHDFMTRGAGSALFQASPISDESGVVDLPPMTADSIYIQGSNGLAKWVTVRGAADDGGNNDDDDDDGSRRRKRGREEDEALRLHEPHPRLAPSRRSILPISIGSLLHTAKKELAAEKAHRQQQQQQREKIANDEKLRKKEDAQQQVKQRSPEESLWVLKYAPKKYHELLSDEATNLRLLQWLKQWDPYVFNPGHSTSSSKEKEKAAKLKGSQDNLLLFENNTSGQEAQGQDLRPLERIVLIVGPPGVGKTTLAHVLARHCGYEVTEVNASADRTVATLESLISTAVSPLGGQQHPQHQSTAASTMYRSLSKPRCLVIDEMDGIVANVVQILLKQDIHRPVLCLANNLYAPALKELRLAVSTTLHVPPLNPQRLLLRLEVVTAMEHLAVSRAVLSELVAKSNGDVRCCLNTLQFLRRQTSSSAPSSNQQHYGEQDVITQLTGKDIALGPWSLWQDVLQKKDRKKYLSLLSKDQQPSAASNAVSHEAGAPAAAARCKVDPGFVYVQSLLDNCQDFDVLLDGLFQYYAMQRYSDISLERTRKISRAFAFQENLTAASFQIPALMQLAESNQRVTALACFAYCASTYRLPNLSYPREQLECVQRLRGAESALQLFSQHPLLAYTFMERQEIALTTAPLLLRCLYPAGLRIQPTQLSLSSFIGKEQDMARDCTERHVAYRLTYRPKQGGSYDRKVYNNVNSGGDGSIAETWVLDPPIHDLGGASVISSHQAKAARAARLAQAAAPGGQTILSSAARAGKDAQQAAVPVLALSEHAKQCIAGWGIQVALTSRHNQQQAAKAGAAAEAAAKIPLATPQKRPREELADPIGGPPQTTSVPTPVKTPEVLRQAKASGGAVKRDFFGRLVSSTTTASSDGPKSSLGQLAVVVGTEKTARTKTPPPQLPPSCVKYLSYDGCTRGVKIAARLADFLGPNAAQ